MASKATIITRVLHSRGTAILMTILSLIAFCICYAGGGMVHIAGDKGVAFLSANGWFAPGVPDFLAAIVSYGLAIFLMISICKIFNVLRSMTWLYVTLFAIMQAATPDLAVQFFTGDVLLIVVQICMLLMLGLYRETRASEHVFLIFFLLSLLTTTQYCYVAYMFVFLMACVQMQVLNGRTLVAALTGIVTPWWILLGFGVVSPDDIHLPTVTSIFSEIEPNDTFLLLISVGFTAFLIVLALVLNVFRTIAYNARARAVNGVFTVLSLVTIVTCCIDFRNLISYIPLLNFCAALQVAHYFATHRADKSYIAIMLIIAAYIAIYICQGVM